MDNSASNSKLFQARAEQMTHMEQLQKVERFNGRAAMVGIVIGVVVEGLTGFGIAHQIGLGALVDGYAACRAQFLPFCL
ncbi:MAG: high light inducible protein [Synechococcaceae bacterium WBA_2_066]|nr:high light inducible protein [Synechococcaceae bacterium WB6_1A_059]NBP32245.1 high light inducible protein [Synechococcaceae bacterium WB6_1B_055]NBP99377.1 high light inducible protein [Synechococcaceae bacterium WB6_3A_227]NBQ19331.1 high light inducible protein [Synechococcaceae bacterium WB5_2A_257]NBR44727.1 high light inducible protein [Synechococcaceae bacterium WB5_2B_268]NBY58843.1 high light inducible protein [Synechococcaceae bacterium LLD_019]NCU76641.1 high light inducible pr